MFSTGVPARGAPFSAAVDVRLLRHALTVLDGRTVGAGSTGDSFARRPVRLGRGIESFAEWTHPPGGQKLVVDSVSTAVMEVGVVVDLECPDLTDVDDAQCCGLSVTSSNPRFIVQWRAASAVAARRTGSCG